MLENPLPLKNRLFTLINQDCPTLKETKTLIVGVGGIGCELLKVLCKIPIGTVHVIDMDTIEVIPFLFSSPILTVSFSSKRNTKACQKRLWPNKPY